MWNKDDEERKKERQVEETVYSVTNNTLLTTIGLSWSKWNKMKWIYLGLWKVL